MDNFDPHTHPVPSVISVTSSASTSASTAGASAPVALTASVTITVSATISQLDDLSMTSAYASLERTTLLSWVRVSTPANNALLILHVSAHIISRPTVAYEADVIRSNLSSEGDLISGAGSESLAFWVELDAYIHTIGNDEAHVALPTCWVETPKKLSMTIIWGSVYLFFSHLPSSAPVLDCCCHRYTTSSSRCTWLMTNIPRRGWM